MKRKVHDDLIAGLDLGSSGIRIAVGQMLQNGGNQCLHILGMAQVPSQGIHKGVITSIEDAVSATSACLELIERSVGSPVEHLWVGVNGHNITTTQSRGAIAVANVQGEISEDDVERVIDAARTVAMPLNFEILHVIPRRFIVDSGNPVKDPVSMSGVRLEVDTHIVQGASSHIKNLTKTVYRTGVDIDDVVLSILAAGEVVTSQRGRDMGCVVIDIGGSMTSVIVFEDGDMIHTASIPIGSDHITADIAIGLKISLEIAERIKRERGTTSTKGMSKKEVINLSHFGAHETDEVSLKYVAQIIEARTEEILEKVAEELRSLGKDGLLPAGALFIGGGAKLAGLMELAKRVLRLPAGLGYPLDMTSVTDKINDISFVTALGLVQWGVNVRKSAHDAKWGSFSQGISGTKNAIRSMGKWMKALLP